MDTYKGTISGIGDSESRLNEITGDDLAAFRNFVIGYTDYKDVGGVINQDGHDFDYSVDGDTIHLTDGFAFAYGYGAYHAAENITFLLPAVEQYYIIYLVFDKSVIPNSLLIKTKSNYASDKVGAHTFRQDQLSTVKTGVFEMPLWLFKITNKGIDEDSFVDLRKLRDKIEKVEYSDKTHTVLGEIILPDGTKTHGYLEEGVTAVTQPTTDNSKKGATTAFVQAAVQAEINK